MKLKDKSAFPRDTIAGVYAKGMTYREWLVGQIAAGPTSTVFNDSNVQLSASHIIAVADEIIKQLKNE